MLAIIIVSWNVRDLLDRCLTTAHASLAGAGIAYRIVVVDNASTDGTCDMLRAKHPGVEVIATGCNLGFAGGNNLALRRILAHDNSCIRYVLLLNPDTEAVGDAIPVLVRYLEERPDVAVVGPRLRYPDGTVQSTRRRFPTPGVLFWESTPLEWRWSHNPWVRRYRCIDLPDDREQTVDWLVGAALMVRRSAIERAGLLDAGFVMYSEELEWQQRLRAYGRIVYLPSAEIVHHEGKSSAQVPTWRLITFHQSRLRYARLRYGDGLAKVLRIFLMTTYGAELCIEGGKWLLGHRRDLRRQRIAGYLMFLRALARGEESGAEV
ncbi:MAG: glycosyltransferase family 2 protein [Roseiflexaceae bacterium]|nr:glycosyltransferase family 2 protein [Roseiflexaceae bacterium]